MRFVQIYMPLVIQGLIVIKSIEFGGRKNATFTLLWDRSQCLNSRRFTSGICWNYPLFRSCCALVLGGKSEQVGVEAAESWAGCEHMGWPWGGSELLQLTKILLINWTRAGSTEARLRSGAVSSQGSLGYLCCITASFPPLVPPLCHTRINLMKPTAWKNFRLAKHGPKSSRIPSLCT